MENDKCCGCMHPTTALQFEATAARYNDRSAFANNNSQDNGTLNLSMFQAMANRQVAQTPLDGLASGLAALAGAFSSLTHKTTGAA